MNSASFETVADMYSTRNNMVDCNAFLEALSSRTAMASFNHYLFGHIDNICTHERLTSLDALFKAYMNSSRIDTINENQLQKALGAMNISVHPEEVRLMLIEYDSTG